MAQAIMADSFEPHKRGLAFAVYGLVTVLAPSIGPTLGGWITDNYSWHWIFYINIPVGILAFYLTSRLVEDPPFAKSDRKNLFKLDYVGVALLVIAMGALQIGLDKGEENDWFGSQLHSRMWRRICDLFCRADDLGVVQERSADRSEAVQVSRILPSAAF